MTHTLPGFMVHNLILETQNKLGNISPLGYQGLEWSFWQCRASLLDGESAESPRSRKQELKTGQFEINLKFFKKSILNLSSLPGGESAESPQSERRELF